MALHWFQFLSSTEVFWFFADIQRCHRLSSNRAVRLFMPAAGARPKEAKITLMDCICMYSEV